MFWKDNCQFSHWAERKCQTKIGPKNIVQLLELLLLYLNLIIKQLEKVEGGDGDRPKITVSGEIFFSFDPSVEDNFQETILLQLKLPAPYSLHHSLSSHVRRLHSQLISRLQTIVSKLFQRRKIYSSLPYVCLNERWNFQ